MSNPAVEYFNVNSEDYHIEVPVDNEVLPSSNNPVESDAVLEAINSGAITDLSRKQYKQLASPVTVGGASKTTVEDAIQALADLRVSSPVAGSKKLLTAGGAYSDKRTTPASASTQNITVQNLGPWFQNSPTYASWLGKVFGPKLGKSWTQGSGGTSYSFRAVYYANGIWVAGSSDHGTGGYGLWWSTDGKAWTQTSTTAIQSYSFDAVYYANGIWVAGSYNHGFWWSTDGKAWVQGTGTGPSTTMTTIYYANGIWVAGDDSHGLWWSTDGKAWTQGTGSLDDAARSVYYANGIWVAGSDGYGLWWSTDGKAWTQGTGGTFYYFPVVYYANGIWVAGSGNGHGLWWSTDGKSWTQGTGGTSYYFPVVYYANGIWVAGSGYPGGSYNDHGLWYSGVADLGYV